MTIWGQKGGLTDQLRRKGLSQTQRPAMPFAAKPSDPGRAGVTGAKGKTAGDVIRVGRHGPTRPQSRSVRRK